jgi:polar amino acid transport system substrate-binding protein
MPKSIYFIVAFVLITTGQAAPLKMGYISAPPLSYTSKEGKPVGLLPSIANRAFIKTGLEYKYYHYPVARIYTGLKNGTLDIYNCGTSKMPNTFRGKKTLLKMDLGVFSNISAKKVKSLTDLKGERVALFRGANASGIQKSIENPKNKILFHKLPALRSMIKYVQKGRADHLLLYKRMIPDYQAKGFRFSSLKKAECRWLISDKVKNAKAILKSLDANSFSMK